MTVRVLAFFFFCLSPFISAIGFSADGFSDRLEVLDAARSQAPMAARLICPQYLSWQIYRDNIVSLRNPFQGRSDFRSKLKAYNAETEKLLGETKPHPYLLKLQMDTFTSSTLSESFYQSVKSTFRGDFVDLLSLQDFFLRSLFSSEEFARTLDECIDYFGVPSEGLLGRIQTDVLYLNRSGYLVGRGFSVIVGMGVGKLISGAGAIGKWIFYGAAVPVGLYLAYEILTPAVTFLKFIERPGAHPEDSIFLDFTDPRAWPNLYNDLLALRDAHIAAMASPLRPDLQGIVLFKTRSLQGSRQRLEQIRRSFTETSRLNEEQKAIEELVIYALAMLNGSA